MNQRNASRQNRISAFIFDMDGTLVDNMQFHVEAWRIFLLEHNKILSEEEFHERISGTIGEAIGRIFGAHLSAGEVVELGRRKEAIYRELYGPHISPIPGLLDFLDTSRRLGIAVALATSADSTNIKFILNGLNMHSYFESIVGGDDVTFGKPHSETFLKAAEKLGKTPSQCLVFEDVLSGVEAARRAEMEVVALATTSPSHVFSEISIVQHTIKNYFELSPETLIRGR